MREFQHFVCIDWSGAKSRWHKGIAVALCERGQAAPLLIDPPERHWTRASVLDWLHTQAREKHDMLIGLDLSLALPFVREGAYFPGWSESPPQAKALWALVDSLSQDDDHLAATRFVDHPEIAPYFRQQGKCGALFGSGRGRLRDCEALGQADIAGINPYSCFNLVGAAQVGKSSLTGMRVLHQLKDAIPVWPIDAVRAQGPVIVEIYTSIAARASGVLPMGKAKITDPETLDKALARFKSAPHVALNGRYTDHATDAILTAAWLRANADRSDYWHPERMSATAAQTEGWTFGVV
jgi:hypothetical protein